MMVIKSEYDENYKLIISIKVNALLHLKFKNVKFIAANSVFGVRDQQPFKLLSP